jgi:hypothetical protein
MHKLGLILLVLLLSVVNSFSQNNPYHGFIFRDVKEPRNNPFRATKNPQHRAELAMIYREIPEFNPKEYIRDKHNRKVHQSVNAILQNPEISNFGRSVLHYESFLYKLKYGLVADTVYSIDKVLSSVVAFPMGDSTYESHYDWLNSRLSSIPLNPVIYGWNDLIQHYNQAIFYSDERGQKVMKMALLRHVENSYLLEYLETFIRKNGSFSSPVELSVFTCQMYIDSLQSIDLAPEIAGILQVVHSAFIQTNFKGDEDLLSINPSINYKRDNAHWIGCEIAMDLSSNRYLYQPFRNGGHSRMSFFHFGVNFQLPANGLREYYFGMTRFSNFFGLYLKLVQFGFLGNIPEIEKITWFYKPQIGLSYGNFQVFYSYTHIFEKELRYVVPRHAINIRFSLPLYRVQPYSY